MGTVVINRITFNIIGDRDDANAYLLSRLGSEAWIAADNSTRDLALKTASDTLFSFLACFDVPNLQAIFDAPTADQPQTLRFAAYELSQILTTPAGRNTILNVGNTGSNLRRAAAGSAEVEFFQPVAGTRFPNVVQVLLSQYSQELGLSFSGGGIFADLTAGTDNVSSFGDANQFGLTEGL